MHIVAIPLRQQFSAKQVTVRVRMQAQSDIAFVIALEAVAL
jgi:hypothetical protein